VRAFARVALLAAALWLGADRIAAQEPGPLERAWRDGAVLTGRLSFDGKGTLGAFTGVTTSLQGEMQGAERLAGVRGWVEAPVATLVTGNDRRDRDLAKSMETATYPTMRFDLDGVRPDSARGDTVFAGFRGRFTIHGVERPAEFPATLVAQGVTVRATATTPLNLKDYRIGGLSKFLGVFRMDERIIVHIDVTFQARQ